MGKHEIINGKTDRSGWPKEAILCELIYNFGTHMKTYEPDSYESLELAAWPAIQMLSEIVTVSDEYIDEVITKGIIAHNDPKHHIFQMLTTLGTTLASSQWWERYEQVVKRMGTTCVIAVRVAVQVFKVDAQKDYIKMYLKELSRVFKEVENV